MLPAVAEKPIDDDNSLSLSLFRSICRLSGPFASPLSLARSSPTLPAIRDLDIVHAAVGSPPVWIAERIRNA